MLCVAKADLLNICAMVAIILDRLLYLWESSGIMTWLMASGFVIMHGLMVGFAAAAAKVLRGIALNTYSFC